MTFYIFEDKIFIHKDYECVTPTEETGANFRNHCTKKIFCQSYIFGNLFVSGQYF